MATQRNTSIRLDVAELELLDLIARIEGRSLSDEIREGIKLLLRTKIEDEQFRKELGRFQDRLQKLNPSGVDDLLVDLTRTAQRKERSRI